jgi:D-serine deaminase-like pyridoxal phosphate-dependent protein
MNTWYPPGKPGPIHPEGMNYESCHKSFVKELMAYDYEYYQKIVEGYSFPMALIDMDLLDKNIELIQEQAQATPIRIASKSIRCRYLIDYIKHKLDHCAGVMTYHGREALWLSRQVNDHYLIGYPVVDKKILGDIGLAVKEGRKIVLMVDHPHHLELLEEVGREIEAVFPVCLDLDLSVDFGPLHFGVWRSPITDEKKLDVFLEALKNKDHLRLEGLMGYEAQIAGVGDQVNGQALKSAVIRQLKKRSLPRLRKRRAAAVDQIRRAGHRLTFVNGGGTGSVLSTREEKTITEIAVGSGFFCPHLFDNYQDFKLHPAAFFALQIVRQPKEGVYTCHGGGYIASGGVEALKAPQIHLLPGARLDANEGAGEVQTPVFYKGKEALKIGDPVFFRHAKAGELCEHFKELHLIRNGEIVKSVPTYRGEGKNFL